MPLTTGIGTGNNNQVAVFTTPTNSATIGHLSDSVPHKQPTLHETAKPHDAVPGSAGGSNGLSPHEGIFDLLNHRVGTTGCAEFESAQSLAFVQTRLRRTRAISEQALRTVPVRGGLVRNGGIQCVATGGRSRQFKLRRGRRRRGYSISDELLRGFNVLGLAEGIISLILHGPGKWRALARKRKKK